MLENLSPTMEELFIKKETLEDEIITLGFNLKMDIKASDRKIKYYQDKLSKETNPNEKEVIEDVIEKEKCRIVMESRNVDREIRKIKLTLINVDGNISFTKK